MILRSLTSPLFPYTTLFRSWFAVVFRRCDGDDQRRRRSFEDSQGPSACTRRQIKRIAGEGNRNCVVSYSGEARYLPSSASARSEEHTSELQSQFHLVCRLLL